MMKTTTLVRLRLFGLALALACLAAPLRAQDEGSSYARNRDFDLQHVRLDLAFDLDQRKVLGTALLRLEPINSGLTEVALDSIGLDIESVTLAGRPLTFRRGDNKLYVTLDRPYASGDRLELTIRYTTRPRKGLFFILPDKDYPDRPHQIWTQGQASDNRYWFPSYDFPNDKTTTELRVTVPAGWEAVSNGKLLGAEENKRAGTRTFHWLQDKPHSTYLVSLVAGDFERREEKWKDVPLRYYVPPGQSSNIPHTFGRTANMMEFFSTNIAPYPWAQYAQTPVEDFLYGGMENTSATTMARSWLLEPEVAPDLQMGNDGGIAHELAHQWFGDLLTCKDWRHIWLNEGFATYFEDMWTERYYGRDQYDWDNLRRGWQLAGQEAVQRAVMVRRPQPGEGGLAAAVAGRLVYSKGAWVLHMLRHQLGDERFWKAIRHYVSKHNYQNVETSDFFQAVSEATGQDFEWLADQYVYGPGFPEFEVAWDYNSDTHLVHVAVKQTLKRDDKPALFRLPVEIEVVGDAATRKYTVQVSREGEDFYFPSDQRPRMVLFDPANGLLKKLTFKKDDQERIYQLANAKRSLNRAEAAEALGKSGGSTEVLAALERAGTSDSFYGVRVEVAEALGELKSEAARPALLKMLADQHARVRRAASEALGTLKRDEPTVARLLELARSDSSLRARATALETVGRLKPDSGTELLLPFLAMDSARDTIRVAAVTALGALADDKVLPTLLEWSQRGKPSEVRIAALRALANVGKGKEEVRERLLEALNDPYFRVRSAAVQTLSQRRETAAVEALERLAKSEVIEQVAGIARRAVETLRQPAERTAAQRGASADGGELAELRKRLAELEKENQELKARLDRLEKQPAAASQR